MLANKQSGQSEHPCNDGFSSESNDSYDSVQTTMNSASCVLTRPSGQNGFSPHIARSGFSNMAAVGMMVVGGLCIVGGIGLALVASLLALASALSGMLVGILSALFVVSGGILLAKGLGTRALSDAMAKISRALAKRSSIALDELSNMVSMPIATLRKKLKRAIRRGIIAEGHLANIDGHETLYLSNSAYYECVQASKDAELEKRRAASAQAERNAIDAELCDEAQSVLGKCSTFRLDAQMASKYITNTATNKAIDCLIQKVKKVEDHVRRHPQDALKLERYTDYYLPTTAKLLEALCELDRSGVVGDNADSTRDEVDKTVEMISKATDKLLDDLLQAQSWDVSSDASVMRTMLKQDNLASDGMHHNENASTAHAKL